MKKTLCCCSSTAGRWRPGSQALRCREREPLLLGHPTCFFFCMLDALGLKNRHYNLPKNPFLWNLTHLTSSCSGPPPWVCPSCGVPPRCQWPIFLGILQVWASWSPQCCACTMHPCSIERWRGLQEWRRLTHFFRQRETTVHSHWKLSVFGSSTLFEHNTFRWKAMCSYTVLVQLYQLIMLAKSFRHLLLFLWNYKNYRVLNNI